MNSVEVLQRAAQEERALAADTLKQAEQQETHAKRLRSESNAHASNAEALESDIALLLNPPALAETKKKK